MPRRLLVADDDELLLTSLATLLEQRGYAVATAMNGAELVEHLSEGAGAYDAVLTDISMPWMDGVTAIRDARDAGIRTPFIVMTALDDDSIQRRTGVLGPNVTVLRKPFEIVDLWRALDAVLGDAHPAAP